MPLAACQTAGKLAYKTPPLLLLVMTCTTMRAQLDIGLRSHLCGLLAFVDQVTHTHKLVQSLLELAPATCAHAEASSYNTHQIPSKPCGVVVSQSLHSASHHSAEFVQDLQDMLQYGEGPTCPEEL